jgi:hypothetical protein
MTRPPLTRADIRRARRLWADDYNVRAWLRAVALVRQTRRGWLIERPVERRVQP